MSIHEVKEELRRRIVLANMALHRGDVEKLVFELGAAMEKASLLDLPQRQMVLRDDIQA